MRGDEVVLLREILEEMKKQTNEMRNCFNAVYQINGKIGNIEKRLLEMEIELFGELDGGKGE